MSREIPVFLVHNPNRQKNKQERVSCRFNQLNKQTKWKTPAPHDFPAAHSRAPRPSWFAESTRFWPDDDAHGWMPAWSAQIRQDQPEIARSLLYWNWKVQLGNLQGRPHPGNGWEGDDELGTPMHVGGSVVDESQLSVERNISVFPLPPFANKKRLLTIFVTLSGL